MVDASQSENLDVDTVMVDAPPLALPEEILTVLPKEIDEILTAPGPLPENPVALPEENLTALPKEIEEILTASGPLPENPTALPKEMEDILAGVNVNSTSAISADLSPADANPPLNPPNPPLNLPNPPPARTTKHQTPPPRSRIGLARRALLPPAGEATYGSSGLPRTENDRFPVLPVPGEQGAHRSLSSRGWAGGGR
jgi:hypothetical protein